MFRGVPRGKVERFCGCSTWANLFNQPYKMLKINVNRYFLAYLPQFLKGFFERFEL